MGAASWMGGAAALLLLVMVAASGEQAAAADRVSVQVQGLQARIGNGLVSALLDKGVIRQLSLGTVNVLDDSKRAAAAPGKPASGYLDYTAASNRRFAPTSLQVLEQTPSLVHLAYMDRPDAGDGVTLEEHFIVRQGVSGLYSYVVASNRTAAPLRLSELRSVYRFDALRFDHVSNGLQAIKPRLYAQLAQLPRVQDETWQLPAGDAYGGFYSKYDLAGYQRQTPAWGVYGQLAPEQWLGAWIIPGSGEYFAGDRLKQDLLVHQDALALVYLTSTHLGSVEMVAPPGWSKLYGPWLLYLNQAQDPRSLYAAAVEQSRQAAGHWPYTWVHDIRYFTRRSVLKGRFMAAHARQNSHSEMPPLDITLGSSLGETPSLQNLGYAYTTTSRADGSFQLQVPAGRYRLTVYARGGDQPGLLADQVVTVAGDTVLPPQPLALQPPPVWAIGQTDRQSTGFALADRPRRYDLPLQVPADIVFTVGQSRQQDWYYAQTRPGTWTIRFRDQPDGHDRVLTLAFAGASAALAPPHSAPSMQITMNGTPLARLRLDNDKSMYRSANQSGRYSVQRIHIPAQQVNPGANTIALQLLGGQFMYDAVLYSTD
ncbi:polysaccharide lyase family protein [Paludibacterium yongneupense]|uniref:polysaccharide lyase family protein n=1 Tax=Paludibacterium yongneupense TaxID=400061 RepID=UPI0004014A2C|nr:polysaccharide lyase family protein [Paludibacterium yongneupense]